MEKEWRLGALPRAVIATAANQAINCISVECEFNKERYRGVSKRS